MRYKFIRPALDLHTCNLHTVEPLTMDSPYYENLHNEEKRPWSWIIPYSLLGDSHVVPLNNHHVSYQWRDPKGLQRLHRILHLQQHNQQSWWKGDPDCRHLNGNDDWYKNLSQELEKTSATCPLYCRNISNFFSPIKQCLPCPHLYAVINTGEKKNCDKFSPLEHVQVIKLSLKSFLMFAICKDHCTLQLECQNG